MPPLPAIASSSTPRGHPRPGQAAGLAIARATHRAVRGRYLYLFAAGGCRACRPPKPPPAILRRRHRQRPLVAPQQTTFTVVWCAATFTYGPTARSSS